MKIDVWVVTGGDFVDKVWGVHFSLDEAHLHAMKLQADGVRAVVELGLLAVRESDEKGIHQITQR